jgi:hypothetical protein
MGRPAVADEARGAAGPGRASGRGADGERSGPHRAGPGARGLQTASNVVLLATPWMENQRLSIEPIAETGKIESAGDICPGVAEGRQAMATELTPKGAGGKKPEAKEAPAKKAVSSKKPTANGPAASAKATPAPKAKKRLPAATIRALKELEAGTVDHEADEAAPCTRSHIPNARTRKALRDADAGKNLTRYVDADDLFRKLGIKLGQEEA